ncbi:MAG TPA: transglycosylase SLT domain-containing protein [Woeseiaceae bacterium]|nr:transglycosylase SLT domain-containing protein [Woeseiaceae bacterium]
MAFLKPVAGIVAALWVLLLGTADAGSELDRQRELFRQVYAEAERGAWDAVDALSAEDRELLRSYLLWPDLRAAWFRATIRKADMDEIEAFLERYGMLKPARELRYRYALHLADAGLLDRYLRIYRSYYQGLGVDRLDCIALHAEIEAGDGDRIVRRGRELWLTGYSQADECDPVFEWMREARELTEDDYRARFALAVEAREFTRARWLARSLDDASLALANHWLQAQTKPEHFVDTHGERADSDVSRQQLAYAVERITYRDPEVALRLWNRLENVYAFSPQTRHETRRHIALWTARNNRPGAYELLTSLPLEAQDEEVMRWRARVSLREERWTDLLDDIAMMVADERNSEQWLYWRAVGLARSGNDAAAKAVLEPLAAERSYYGFLAADELGVDYAFAHDTLRADETVIESLARRPDLVRARELFLVGLDGRGRSEWDAAMAGLDDDEKTQAAVLAHRWGWHSRAIATAAVTGHYDDLALRYPLPFRQSFEQGASSASISTTWALGIARSESLFMRDVRSRAGAIGLMQLMPATGRQVAREINLSYSGPDTLTDPDHNIRLGTSYLGSMAARYDGNHVLATAAYNAGPHRVDRWLPRSAMVDARIWIENIPYNETRRYVRRVLAADTIFHWRLTGEMQRLSDRLPQVRPLPADQQLASR